MITTTMSSSISVKPRAVTRIPPGAEGGNPGRAPNSRPNCGHHGAFLQEACLTLRVHPILSGAYSYDQGDAQLGYPFHLAFYKTSGFHPLPIRHLKYQLVMDLQNHLRVETLSSESGLDPNHGNLDEVCRRSLQWRVGGGALAERTDAEVPIAQLRDVATSPE